MPTRLYCWCVRACVPPCPYEHTLFPVEVKEPYFAQLVPNTESSYPEGGRNTTDALVTLPARIGPASRALERWRWRRKSASRLPDVVTAMSAVGRVRELVHGDSRRSMVCASMTAMPCPCGCRKLRAGRPLTR